LAAIQFRLGDRDKALDLARESVKGATNQVQPLANLADLLHRAGRAEEAAECFGRLRDLSSYVDMDLPVVRRLAGLADDRGLPQDWRREVLEAGDVGERPSLETLGPFRWRPYEAPDWSLPDPDGKVHGLADYIGRPVLVIFYLGHGCIHCIEQLNIFAPQAAAFQKAGIAMIAISADTVEGLSQTLDSGGAAGGYPFPLVSNPGLDVFKAYRAHDDFENMALHGTFLIDGRGLVRWQDINYEPFTEADFLLKESIRLLAQPKPGVIVAGPRVNGAARKALN
jgi:peroxiredoxin